MDQGDLDRGDYELSAIEFSISVRYALPPVLVGAVKLGSVGAVNTVYCWCGQTDITPLYALFPSMSGAVSVPCD